MREIKFRAKYKDNKEWSYFTLKEIIEEDGIMFEHYHNWCQYIGLKDNKRTKEFPNGQEIYEGNICKAMFRRFIKNKGRYENKGIRIGIIKWQVSGYYLVVKYKKEEMKVKNVGDSIAHRFMDSGGILNDYDTFDFNTIEVIGNIDDNTKLIK